MCGVFVVVAVVAVMVVVVAVVSWRREATLAGRQRWSGAAQVAKVVVVVAVVEAWGGRGRVSGGLCASGLA